MATMVALMPGDVNMLVRPFGLMNLVVLETIKVLTRYCLGGGSPNLKQKRVNFNNAEMLSIVFYSFR
jgi:hypothetical protein